MHSPVDRLPRPDDSFPQQIRHAYLAYWNDFETEQIYVYGRLLFTLSDVGQALLALDRDLWIDPTPMAEVSPLIDEALLLAERDVNDEDDTPWHPASRKLILELMGFDATGYVNYDPISLGDALAAASATGGDCCRVDDPCCPYCGIAGDPPALLWTLAPPPGTSPGRLITFSLAAASGCEDDDDDEPPHGGCGPNHIPCNGRCCRQRPGGVTCCGGPCCPPGIPCCGGNVCCWTGEICVGGKCCPEDCDDNNPCTEDSCPEHHVCEHTPISGPACQDDGDPCTDDVCLDGWCTHPPTNDPCHPICGNPCLPECIDCDDDDPCTIDWCEDGACKHDPFCPPGVLCCKGECCYEQVLAASVGSCCDVELPLICCPPNACCWGECINDDTECCPGKGCPAPPGSEVDEICCGACDSCAPLDGCCPPGGQVCPDGSCCYDGTPCTVDRCECADSECITYTCVFDPACNDGDPCTADQCGLDPDGCAATCEFPCLADCTSCPGGVCDNCACVPGSCSFSVDSGDGCPGSTVELTLTGSCQPDCGTMTFSMDKSVQYLTVNLPDSIPCDGTSYERTFTVDIDPEAPPGPIVFQIIGTTPAAECTTLVTVTVREPEKIPLGGEVSSTEDPGCFKVYMPTKWGGKLNVTTTSGTIENLKYPDGTPYANNTETGENKHGWYTFKVTGSSSYTVSSTFTQQGQAATRPWNFYWWSTNPPLLNLYEEEGDYQPLVKYDARHGTAARDWEAANHNTPVDWCGHCLGGSIASITLAQPTPIAGSAYNAEELGGLWAELGEQTGHIMGDGVGGIPPGPPVAGADGTDEYAPKFHRLLEEYVKSGQVALYAQLRSDGGGADEVWNHAVFKFAATFEEAPGGDEKVVRITNLVTANDDHTPPTDDTSTREPLYVYIITYGAANGEPVSNAARTDWIFVGGEASFAPAILAVVATPVWAANNPNVTEANVRADDVAN